MKYWITPEQILDRTAFYCFSRSINCSAEAKLHIKISADTRYQLRVNGNYVCEGPCTGDHHYWRYEEVDVPTEYLRAGENVISVRVLFIADESFWPAARKERPVLWFDGTVNDGENSFEIESDESWNCGIDHGTYLKAAPIKLGIAPSMPPCQFVENDGDIRPVAVKKYLPIGTEPEAPDSGEPRQYTYYGLKSEYLLEPRSIPLLKPAAPMPFRVVKRGDDYMELDAGVYTTAYPEFVFRGEVGCKIKITYTEAYFTDAETLQKGDRASTDGVILGAFEEIAFNGKLQRFEPYWYHAFRYIRLDFPVGTELDPVLQTYRPYFYPLEETGKFVCSDPIKNAMWEVSKNTLLCCTHETFIDCPFYEQCQYDMDSALEMMFMLRLTGDGRMAKKAVLDLARSQQPDGMLCAHYPSTQVQIIPNFSLYWILMLRDYVTYTGDLDFAKEMLPVAEKILNSFDMWRDENGLCKATKFWNYLDWVPKWKYGVPCGGVNKPSTVTTMLYSAALGAASGLADECGRKWLAEEYSERAEMANDAVNTHCYNKERGMYIDVYGAEPNYSEHTAVWAVLCGAIKGEAAAELVDRVFSDGSDVDHASFSFNYYTFRAIEKAGLYKKYSGKLMRGWEKMLQLNCTTWCEAPVNPRSECHAWSSAPIYEFSAVMLGVQPLTTGYGEVKICPDIDSCDSASGTVPTPMGIISVSWDKAEDGSKLVKVVAPTGMKKHISLGGKDIVTDAEIYTQRV